MLRNTLITILRKTIKNLEQESGLSADHPHLAEAKRSLQLMIAGLQLPDTAGETCAAMDELPLEDAATPVLEAQSALIDRAQTNRCCARTAGRRRRGRQ